MDPANPPFAVPSSFPFQPVPAGIQISIAICESAVGEATTLTRQNAGTFASRPPADGENDPAGTDFTEAIDTFGISSAPKSSHVAAGAADDEPRLGAVSSARPTTTKARVTTGSRSYDYNGYDRYDGYDGYGRYD